MFDSFRRYCILKEMAANKSAAHLLAVAHSNRLMVIISSYREGVDQPPPRSLDDLKSKIRAASKDFEIKTQHGCGKPGEFGYTPAKGGFKETDPITGRSYEVCEDSLIVSYSRDAEYPGDVAIIEFFTKLAKDFNQEAFLFKSPTSDEVVMIGQDGQKSMIGKMDAVGSHSPYFTELKKGQRGRRVTGMEPPTKADPLGDEFGFDV